MENPIDILSSLGMFKLPVAGSPKLNLRDIEKFAKREEAFDWFHMGNSSLTIEELYDAISHFKYLSIPRTGHVGNWQEIAFGRAGTLDHNGVVCGNKNLGYPLLYDFNQTEDSALSNGDHVYLPGSYIENGKRNILKLFSWDGNKFSEHDRSQSLFLPFVLTPMENELSSLIQFHYLNTCQYYKNVKLNSSVIFENKDIFKEIMVVLLSDAIHSEDPDASLKKIIDKYVTLDGRVSRDSILIKKPGIQIGSTYYSTINELVDSILIPYLAVNLPNEFFINIKQMPKCIPLISLSLNSVLSAIFNSHYPSMTVSRNKMTTPFNPHMGWGAFDKAGYPPISSGYFKKKVKIVRKLFHTVIKNFNQFDPVFYLLLPSTIFTLLPSDAHPNDKEILEKLFKKINDSTALDINNSNILREKIQTCIIDWLYKYKNSLSPYFLNKFTKKRSVCHEGDLPIFSKPSEPPSFNLLTIHQASITVGTMKEILAGQ